MKLRKSGRALLATATTLGLGLGLTSCSPSNTIDYVYVTASKANPGQISVYRVDSESGALTQIQDSPYPSGGRNPVGAVTSPDGKYLYVINKDDNSIVSFAIGTDGKLYPQQTCNTPGSEPVALAINTSETLLYVTDFYSPTTPGGPVYSSANPGPGALVAYTVDKSSGKIGGGNCTPVQQTFVDANNVTQTATYVPVGFSSDWCERAGQRQLGLCQRAGWSAVGDEHAGRGRCIRCKFERRAVGGHEVSDGNGTIGDCKRSDEPLPLRNRQPPEPADRLHHPVDRRPERKPEPAA